MKKKTALPESLELLLDTMCNTFGGIMFIAISLIIMSQMLTKTLQNMTTEQYSEQLMARLEQQVRVLERDIVLLSKKIAEKKSRAEDFSPEKKALIEQFLLAEQETVRLQAEQDQLAAKIAAAQEKLKRLQQTAQAKTDELQKLIRKNEAEKQVNDRLRQQLEQEIRKQNEQLKAIQPKTLRFSIDETTDLAPWFVLVYDGKIYRTGKDFSDSSEVRVETLEGGRAYRLLPIRGTALSTTPEKDLSRLFAQIAPSRYFIFLCTDNESYSTLLVTRRFLRNTGYKVWLSVNPQFLFSRSAKSYKASD